MIYISIIVLIAAVDLIIKFKMNRKMNISSVNDTDNGSKVNNKTDKCNSKDTSGSMNTSVKKLAGGLITLRLYHNKGAFLNSMEKHTKLLKLISTIVLVITLAAFIILYPKKGHKLKKAGLALVLGGAVSNEYERYTKGSVTDYFSINLPFIKNVVFNIGDFGIFAGTLLTFLSPDPEQCTPE